MSGQLPSPFDPTVVEAPRWLREVVARLGAPEVDSQMGMERWLWREGEMGVVIHKQSHTWQVVAFSPRCSVTMRTIEKPDDLEIRMAVMLANLDDYPMGSGR